MATYQEINELLVKVSGREDLADLATRYRAVERAKADVDVTFEKGASQGERYQREVQSLARDHAGLVKELQAAARALDEEAAAAARAAAALANPANAGGLTRNEKGVVRRAEAAEEARRTAAALAEEEAALRRVLAAGVEAAGGQKLYDASLKASTTAILAHSQVLNSARGAANGYRQNITALGYTFNDFFSVSGNMTQRLNAIANNMPMLLAGFGYWGLALSALMPIVGMLLPQLDKLGKAMGFGTAADAAVRAVDRIKDKIKELEATPIRYSIDLAALKAAQAALEKFQKGVAAYHELEESRSRAQEESTAKVKEIYKVADAPQVAADLKENAAREIFKTDPKINELLAKSQGMRNEIDDARREMRRVKEEAKVTGTDGGAELALRAKIERLEKGLSAADDQVRVRAARVREKGGEAETMVGNEKREAEQGRPAAAARRLDQVFRPDLARALEKSTPEAVREQKRAEKAHEDAVAKAGDDLKRRVVDAAMKAVGRVGDRNTKQAVENFKADERKGVVETLDPAHPKGADGEDLARFKRAFREAKSRILDEAGAELRQMAKEAIAAGPEVEARSRPTIVKRAREAAAARGVVPALARDAAEAAATQVVDETRKGLAGPPAAGALDRAKARTPRTPAQAEEETLKRNLELAQGKTGVKGQVERTKAALDLKKFRRQQVVEAQRLEKSRRLLADKDARKPPGRRRPAAAGKPLTPARRKARADLARQAEQEGKAGVDDAEAVGKAEGKAGALDAAAVTPQAAQQAAEAFALVKAIMEAQGAELSQLQRQYATNIPMLRTMLAVQRQQFRDNLNDAYSNLQGTY